MFAGKPIIGIIGSGKRVGLAPPTNAAKMVGNAHPTDYVTSSTVNEVGTPVCLCDASVMSRTGRSPGSDFALVQAAYHTGLESYSVHVPFLVASSTTRPSNFRST
jgi:hypothetical protein